MVIQVNNTIKNILEKLENKGYKAYVVGGFVRDYLMGHISYDVDIATSALPNEIIETFSLNHQADSTYGGIHFNSGKYHFDITTFRKEIKYENRRPVEFEYISSLKQDVLRRDFTINSIYMDSSGNLIDIYKGKKDIHDKIIKSIGNIKEKMTEDPLRMLRAIRFASLLSFSLEDELYNFIRDNSNLIKTLSYTRRKEELSNIFQSSNKLNGLKLIKELGLEESLDIKINKMVKFSDSPLGIWAQIDFSDKYVFSKKELDTIKDVRKICKYGIIDNTILYRYGLYSSIIAGDILDINRSYISSLYKDLPIYNDKDIVINGNDIINILEMNPCQKVKDIMYDIENSILDGSLSNDYESIKKFILKNWK